MATPMNDRVERSFTQWLVDNEKDKLLGEIDLVKLETPHQIFETDEPDPECEDGPEVVLELDEGGFFNPF